MYASPLFQNHGLGGGVPGVGSVLMNGAVGAVGAGLAGLPLTLNLAPPGTGTATPLTHHTIDHIKVA